ncbi:MAG TPA: hypothetical protein VJP78_07705 [Thermoleophilia bacterium]|nr:hypothetical protein [Thermoleophilia bacterium]
MPLRYEKIIEEALMSLSGGPWTAEDLTRAREVISDDLCARFRRDCTSTDVVEWIDSLDAEQLDDLLFQVNADWNAGRDPWALG